MTRSTLLLIGVLACASDAAAETVAVGDLAVAVVVEKGASATGPWSHTVGIRDPGVSELKLRFEAAEPSVPPPVSLE